MSQTRAAYHHGNLRNALIASAVRLIEQDGEAAFSLREAARDVGVSANAAYRHFTDKSALLTAAAVGGHEQLAGRMLKAMDRAAERCSQEPPAIARFKAVGRAYVEFAMSHPELFRLMFSGSGVACLAAGRPATDRRPRARRVSGRPAARRGTQGVERCPRLFLAGARGPFRRSDGAAVAGSPRVCPRVCGPGSVCAGTPAPLVVFPLTAWRETQRGAHAAMVPCPTEVTGAGGPL